MDQEENPVVSSKKSRSSKEGRWTIVGTCIAILLILPIGMWGMANQDTVRRIPSPKDAIHRFFAGQPILLPKSSHASFDNSASSNASSIEVPPFETPAHTAMHPVRIFVIDLDRIQEEGTPFKVMQDFMELRYQESNKEIFALERQLRQEHQELRDAEKISDISKNTLMQRRQALDQKLLHLEKRVMDGKKRLNDAIAVMKNRVDQTLETVIQNVAKKYNADFIINKSVGEGAPVVLFASPHFDLTKEVIATLNDLLKDFQAPHASHILQEES